MKLPTLEENVARLREKQRRLRDARELGFVPGTALLCRVPRLPQYDCEVEYVRPDGRCFHFVRVRTGAYVGAEWAVRSEWLHPKPPEPRVCPAVAEVGPPLPREPGDPLWPEALRSLDLVGVRLAGPTPADTVAGVVAWWRADPAHRRVEIMLNGHVVHARVTRLDPIAVRSIEFQVPSPAERVPATLDALFATEAR